MRLDFSVLTFSLLHSTRFVSARWETGLDGDLYGELPRPTSEPLLYRDDFNPGAILMKTNLGHPSNGTTRRDIGLGERAVTCQNPGYILVCPKKPKPCCPASRPICCSTKSNVCCSIGSFCVGINTCCYDGEVGCASPEGCCPGGTKCCGIWCCTQGYQCKSGKCVYVATGSLSVASKSLETSRSQSLAQQSGSSNSVTGEASVASVGTPTTTGGPSSTTTATTNDNSNSKGNNNIALVGGAVGGVLGVTVIGLVGMLLWRRNKSRPPSPPASKQPFLGQQPTSPTFSANTSYLSGPPVTYAAQAGWQPPQSTMTQGAGSPTAGQASSASQQSASPRHAVNTWIDRPPTIFLENSGGNASQPHLSHPSSAEGTVDPRELYNDALRGSTYTAQSSSNILASAPWASGIVPPPAFPVAPPVASGIVPPPAFPVAPPVAEGATRKI